MVQYVLYLFFKDKHLVAEYYMMTWLHTKQICFWFGYREETHSGMSGGVCMSVQSVCKNII